MIISAQYLGWVNIKIIKNMVFVVKELHLGGKCRKMGLNKKI